MRLLYILFKCYVDGFDWFVVGFGLFGFVLLLVCLCLCGWFCLVVVLLVCVCVGGVGGLVCWCCVGFVVVV